MELKTVIIERRGKKPQKYILIKYLRRNTYFAIKANGGERPRIVYLINLKEEELK